MTVKQLRKALKNYPSDYTVVMEYRKEDADAHEANVVMFEPEPDLDGRDWVLVTPDRATNLDCIFYGRPDLVYLG